MEENKPMEPVIYTKEKMEYLQRVYAPNPNGKLNPVVQREREIFLLDKEARGLLRDMEKVMPDFIKEMREKHPPVYPYPDLRLCRIVVEELEKIGTAPGGEW